MLSNTQAVKQVALAIHKEYQNNYMQGSMQPWYGIDIGGRAKVLDLVYENNNSRARIDWHLKRMK